MDKSWITLAPVLIIIAIIGSFVLSGTVVVESGHVGVVRTLGAVQEKPLEEGFHFKKPFMDSVIQMEIRLVGTEAKASAASKDLQTVTTQLTTQYSINGAMAPKIYQRIGTIDRIASSLVAPAIQESVKSVTAQFTAEQLVTQRQQVKLEIQEAVVNYINATLAEKELEGAINVANMAITDFDFSAEFNRAIELKVKAEQEALQAKNEKLKRVTQAEAAAAEKKLAADALAYQIEAESKARADAIKREAAALQGNPELIKLRTIEKWDGVLPRFSGGGGNVVPFLSLDDLKAGATN